MNESPPLTPAISPIVRGVVHGKMIELESSLDVYDGETVEIHVLRIARDPKRSLEALLKLSGACANDPNAEADFETIERERKASFPKDTEG